MRHPYGYPSASSADALDASRFVDQFMGLAPVTLRAAVIGVFVGVAVGPGVVFAVDRSTSDAATA
jgi:hypothetical protein